MSEDNYTFECPCGFKVTSTYYRYYEEQIKSLPCRSCDRRKVIEIRKVEVAE